MSFFIRLIESTDASRRDLEAIPRVHSMMHHGLKLDEYQNFLSDLYHIVWHFCPIMATAASRMPDGFKNVRYELYERIDEEKGHEDWVEGDLRAFGADVEAVKRERPSLPVQAMIGFNYHTSERVHPCGVLGMLYALEVIASVYGGRTAATIQKSLGMKGPEGFVFLESHATMDVDHMAKMTTLVKTIQDPAAQEAIINSTQVNFYLFGKMFEST